MIDDVYIATLLATTFVSVGAIIALTISGIISSLVALLGLNFAVSSLARHIYGNAPGKPGYNSQYGSGKDWNHKALTDADAGGHMKAYTF